MPRCESHLEAVIADTEVLSSRELRMGSRRALQLHSYPGPVLRKRVVQRPVRPMQVNRSARGLVHRLHSHDMVDVGVGEPDGAERPAPAVELSQETAGLLPRIDYHRVPGGSIGHEITVLGE